MGIVEIKTVTQEENVIVITLPSIKVFENGVYVFNRLKESKIFLNHGEAIKDIEEHFEVAKEKLREMLKGGA